MDKQPKPLSTKKPPVPENDYKVLEAWMTHRIMPGIQPLVKKIDGLIHDTLPNLHYAIKWGKAYYGTPELGWLIELAAYDVSINIVFLNGAKMDPAPPLGTGGETRYLKIRTMEELNAGPVLDFIKQSGTLEGWK